MLVLVRLVLVLVFVLVGKSIDDIDHEYFVQEAGRFYTLLKPDSLVL